jgi:hypothetical protein
MDWARHVPEDSPLADAISSVTNTFATLSRDVTKLEHEWGDKVWESPEVLWDEVHIFSKFSFAGRPRGKMTSMVPANHDSSSVSRSNALSVTSKSGVVQDLGNLTAVLSIWPSDSFSEAQKNQKPVGYQDCSGWVAKYEVWQHSAESVRIAHISIPLNAEEIWMQLLQSFRVEWGERKLSFPLAIGESLFCFMILRTIFKLRPDVKGMTVSCQSALVPMNFAEGIAVFWSAGYRGGSCAYTYSFKFGCDDRRLFFSDSASSIGLGEIHSSHIAVFELDFSDPLRVTLAGSGAVNDLDLLQKVLFHPKRQLILLIYHDGVRTWTYTHGM